MKQGILIATYPKNSVWFERLLSSLDTKYPVYIVITDYKNASIDYGNWIDNVISKKYKVFKDYQDSFELGAIKKILETDTPTKKKTILDEFIFIQDSCEIKGDKLFDEMFSYKGNIALNRFYLSYLGKYDCSVLRKMDIPAVKDKEDSVIQEGDFNKKYIELSGEPKIMFKFFGEPDYENSRFEYKYGRMNLICENDYLIKYKGTWSIERLKGDYYE